MLSFSYFVTNYNNQNYHSLSCITSISILCKSNHTKDVNVLKGDQSSFFHYRMFKINKKKRTYKLHCKAESNSEKKKIWIEAGQLFLNHWKKRKKKKKSQVTEGQYFQPELTSLGSCRFKTVD